MKILNLKKLQKLLPPRKPDAHKGDFGHVLVLGGAPGFGGAVRLAGESALRVGAGLVSIATHPEHAPFINALRPELMCHGIKNLEDLNLLLKHATIIVIGPGLGQDAWGRTLWNAVKDSTLPMIVDADALNLLSKNPMRNQNWILTPHPGEAARLMHHQTIEDIQKSREDSIKKLQKDYGGVVVLKGAKTLIATDKDIFLNDVSNPAMATAGMGDVLTGIVGGLVAQGLSMEDSATLGVAMHSYAATKAEKFTGQRGLLASDLWRFL